MGGATGNHSKERPYRKPTCESKSVLEVAALVRENALGQQGEQRFPPSAEELARPILVVEDYAGHGRLLKEAIQNNGMQCHFATVIHNSELPLICQAAGAVRPEILLFDLRQLKDGGVNVLKEIGKELHLRLIPLVTLVNSAADSQISKDYGLHDCWRLCRPDSEQCVTALRSVLDLQRAILKLPPKGEQQGDPHSGDWRADPARKAP